MQLYYLDRTTVINEFRELIGGALTLTRSHVRFYLCAEAPQNE
jgi:hypothetical protein